MHLNEAVAHVNSLDGIIDLKRLLYRVLDGFIPLFGVGEDAVHEIARAPPSLSLVRRVRRGTLLLERLQVVEAHAEPAEQSVRHRATACWSSVQ